MESVLNLSSFSLLPLVLFVFFFCKWYFRALAPAQKRLPPSPPKLPIIGNLHEVGLLPHRSLQSLSKEYGPLMMLRFGSNPMLVASSADAAREILKNHDLVFSDRPRSSILNRLLHDSLDVAFAPYGEYWRQLKSICVLQLLSNKKVQSFRYVREEETSRMIENIRQKCSFSPPLVNLSEMIVTVTNDVIARIALGRRYSDIEDTNKIVAIIQGFSDLLATFNVADYIPRLAWFNRFNGVDAKVEKVGKDFHEFMDAVLEEHQNRKKRTASDDDATETKGSDFVDILLDIQKGNFTSFPIELATIKAVLFDMVAAGTDAAIID